MTDSSAISRTSQEYLDALTATHNVSSDHKGEGFVDPATVGTKGISILIKQNNFIIQQCTTINRKLNELEQRINELGEQAKRLETGKKAELSLPPDVTNQLIREFRETLSVKGETSSTQPKEDKKKGTTPFYVYQNPYQQLKEAQKKQ